MGRKKQLLKLDEEVTLVRPARGTEFVMSTKLPLTAENVGSINNVGYYRYHEDGEMIGMVSVDKKPTIRRAVPKKVLLQLVKQAKKTVNDKKTGEVLTLDMKAVGRAYNRYRTRAGEVCCIYPDIVAKEVFGVTPAEILKKAGDLDPPSSMRPFFVSPTDAQTTDKATPSLNTPASASNASTGAKQKKQNMKTPTPKSNGKQKKKRNKVINVASKRDQSIKETADEIFKAVFGTHPHDDDNTLLKESADEIANIADTNAAMSNLSLSSLHRLPSLRPLDKRYLVPVVDKKTNKPQRSFMQPKSAEQAVKLMEMRFPIAADPQLVETVFHLGVQIAKAVQFYGIAFSAHLSHSMARFVDIEKESVADDTDGTAAVSTTNKDRPEPPNAPKPKLRRVITPQTTPPSSSTAGNSLKRRSESKSPVHANDSIEPGRKRVRRVLYPPDSKESESGSNLVEAVHQMCEALHLRGTPIDNSVMARLACRVQRPTPDSLCSGIEHRPDLCHLVWKLLLPYHDALCRHYKLPALLHERECGQLLQTVARADEEDNTFGQKYTLEQSTAMIQSFLK